MGNKIIPGLSQETTLIFDRLKEAKIGELLAYDELSKLIGADVQSRGRAYLNSARRKMLNEHNVYFACIPGKGVQRCDDDEVVEEASRERQGIRRKARRAAKKIACADPSNLTPENRLRHATESTVFAFVYKTTGKSALKAIDGAVKTTADALPIGRTLEVLMGNGGKKE